ncbi:PilZ domain-containing protein [Andreprevotia chitinilytica]|uniref:PilZ domain-containing protein n=1 Tax=Andreprevotia chitinilytica TaxID=396808 RepID=UPI000A00AD5C|nr:PilZ domain-containing protein [Andreprevotia chitinilytica]
MSVGLRAQDQRSAVRVPMNCPVKLRTLDFGLSYYGACIDLSVTGLTVRSMFVPRPDEEVEVFVMPPKNGHQQRSPLAMRARVVRCHEVEAGRLYELGLLISEILR